MSEKVMGEETRGKKVARHGRGGRSAVIALF